MRDAASAIQRFVDLLLKGIITPKEFGLQAIDSMLHDEACDPATILDTLPENAREAVLERVREYAAKDYLVRYFYLGRGDTEQDIVERQPKLRNICTMLVGHENPS